MATLFGEKMRQARKEQGLTLDQLAQQTNSSKSYIWELENNDNAKPSAEKAMSIANALNVPIDFLLSDNQKTLKPSAVDDAFFRRFTQLDVQKKEKIKQILDILENDS